MSENSHRQPGETTCYVFPLWRNFSEARHLHDLLLKANGESPLSQQTQSQLFAAFQGAVVDDLSRSYRASLGGWFDDFMNQVHFIPNVALEVLAKNIEEQAANYQVAEALPDLIMAELN